MVIFVVNFKSTSTELRTIFAHIFQPESNGTPFVSKRDSSRKASRGPERTPGRSDLQSPKQLLSKGRSAVTSSLTIRHNPFPAQVQIRAAGHVLIRMPTLPTAKWRQKKNEHEARQPQPALEVTRQEASCKAEHGAKPSFGTV